MATPYLGTIAMFAGNFAPAGWALCQGQLLAIDQNNALFALIGTFYGGDGQTTFGLPDLRGRTIIHWGQGPGLSPYVIGQLSGVEQVTLTAAMTPAHTHQFPATTDAANGQLPVGNQLATAAVNAYQSGVPAQSLAGVTISPYVGGNQPHENRMPFLTVNFIIALQGIFPSRN